MSLYVLEAVFRVFGIRGHVPHDGDFPGPGKPPPAANSNRLMRVLATAIVAIALLALLLWGTVWLSLKLL
jgi:hypothetical protein